jgi:hypothetical protein
MENKPHFKTGNIKLLIKKVGGSPPPIPPETVETARQILSQTPSNTPITRSETRKPLESMPPSLYKIWKNGVEEGFRHLSAFKLILWLWWAGYDKEDIEKLLLEWNSRCRPPEAKTTILKHIKSTISRIKDYFISDSWKEKHSIIDVKPEKIKIFSGQPTIYEFVFSEKSFELDSEEIITPNKFREKYLETFNILLPPIKPEKWSEWLTEKLQMIGEKVQTEQLSSKQESIDAVINYIKTSTLYRGNPRLSRLHSIFVDAHNHILVPIQHIKQILENQKINIKLRRLAAYLEPYLINGSEPFWDPENKKTIRVWIFKSSALGIDTTNAIDIEEEKKRIEESLTEKSLRELVDDE